MYKTISASTRTTKARRLVLVDSERRALPNSLRDHPGLAELLARPGFRGEPGEVAAGSDGAMVVGVGPREDLGPEVLRNIPDGHLSVI